MTAEVTEVPFSIISDLHRSSKSEKTYCETEVRGSLMSVLVRLGQWNLQREKILLEFRVLV